MVTPLGLSSDSQKTEMFRSAVQLPNTVPPPARRAENEVSKPVYSDRFCWLLRSTRPWPNTEFFAEFWLYTVIRSFGFSTAATAGSVMAGIVT